METDKPTRCILEGLLTPNECSELCWIHRSLSVVGYRPHVRSTTLHDIACSAPFLLVPLVSARHKVWQAVEERLQAEGELFVEFTGLISWTQGASIGWHHDSNRSYLTQRDYSAVLYLNTGDGVDFGGGRFMWQDGPEPRAVSPAPGRMVAYTADERSVHAVEAVEWGERFTLTMWFTKNTAHQEDHKVIQQLMRLMTQLPPGLPSTMYMEGQRDIRVGRLQELGLAVAPYSGAVAAVAAAGDTAEQGDSGLAEAACGSGAAGQHPDQPASVGSAHAGGGGGTSQPPSKRPRTEPAAVTAADDGDVSKACSEPAGGEGAGTNGPVPPDAAATAPGVDGPSSPTGPTCGDDQQEQGWDGPVVVSWCPTARGRSSTNASEPQAVGARSPGATTGLSPRREARQDPHDADAKLVVKERTFSGREHEQQGLATCPQACSSSQTAPGAPGPCTRHGLVFVSLQEACLCVFYVAWRRGVWEHADVGVGARSLSAGLQQLRQHASTCGYGLRQPSCHRDQAGHYSDHSGTQLGQSSHDCAHGDAEAGAAMQQQESCCCMQVHGNTAPLVSMMPIAELLRSHTAELASATDAHGSPLVHGASGEHLISSGQHIAFSAGDGYVRYVLSMKAALDACKESWKCNVLEPCS